MHTTEELRFRFEQYLEGCISLREMLIALLSHNIGFVDIETFKTSSIEPTP